MSILHVWAQVGNSTRLRPGTGFTGMLAELVSGLDSVTNLGRGCLFFVASRWQHWILL